MEHSKVNAPYSFPNPLHLFGKCLDAKLYSHLDPFVSLALQKSGNLIRSTLKTYSPKIPLFFTSWNRLPALLAWMIVVTFYLAFLVPPLPSSYKLLSMPFPERSYQNVSQFMSLLCPNPCNGFHCTQRKIQSSHCGSQAMLDLPHPHYLSDPSLPLSSLASPQLQDFVLTVLYARNTLNPFIQMTHCTFPPSLQHRLQSEAHPALPTSHSLLYLFRIFSLFILYLTYHIICWFFYVYYLLSVSYSHLWWDISFIRT